MLLTKRYLVSFAFPFSTLAKINNLLNPSGFEKNQLLFGRNAPPDYPVIKRVHPGFSPPTTLDAATFKSREEPR